MNAFQSSSERATLIRLVIPRLPLRTMEFEAVHVRNPFVRREFAQLKPLLRRIDGISIHAEIASHSPLLAPALGHGPPDGPLAHPSPVLVLDAHLVQVHLGRLTLARKEEASPGARLAEEPVDGTRVAGVVAELGQGIQRGEQHEVLGGPDGAHVEVASLVAGHAVAAVELLVGAGRVGGQRRVDGRLVGESQEDDVLDGAAEARAVEGAACWCRVAHLAGDGDAVGGSSLVLS